MGEVDRRPFESQLAPRRAVHDVFERKERLSRDRLSGLVEKLERQKVAVEGPIEPPAGGGRAFLSREEVVQASRLRTDFLHPLGDHDATVDQEPHEESPTGQRDRIVSAETERQILNRSAQQIEEDIVQIPTCFFGRSESSVQP
ncbi:MAG: hypothetical protein ABJC13_10780 [Acidobacteriota bacterium]